MAFSIIEFVAFPDFGCSDFDAFNIGVISAYVPDWIESQEWFASSGRVAE